VVYQELLTTINYRKYEIDRKRVEQVLKLNEGNFGQVFRAFLLPENENGDKEVIAMKMITLERSEEPEADQKYLNGEKSLYQEAQRMAQLESPFIVKLKGFCIKENPYMILMEFVYDFDGIHGEW
jgi:serine/threonine protein kinase